MKTRASTHRRRHTAYRRGHRAERLALLSPDVERLSPARPPLCAAGGEIDLIVMRGDTIAFVEVKARGLMDDALVAITARQAPALLPRRHAPGSRATLGPPVIRGAPTRSSSRRALAPSPGGRFELEMQ